MGLVLLTNFLFIISEVKALVPGSTQSSAVMGASLNELITLIWNIAITIAGVIFIVFFLTGAIQYLTAAGSDEGVKKAKSTLLTAVIGLVFVLIAWAASKWILSALGLTSLAEIK